MTNRVEKEFAEAIEYLLDHPDIAEEIKNDGIMSKMRKEYLLDHPDIAEEMGRKGREWIEKNFTWEKCAENLERNFMKISNL